jgi:hypothetical protein
LDSDSDSWLDENVTIVETCGGGDGKTTKPTAKPKGTKRHNLASKNAKEKHSPPIQLHMPSSRANGPAGISRTPI